MSGQPEDSYWNVFDNSVQAIDIRKPAQVFGVVEYVSAEVIVSYFARWLFKVEKRTLAELAAIHAVSIPILGGLSAFAESGSILKYEAPFTALVSDGAKGVPAVFAAQYICNTALQGLHAPKLNFQDILVTAASKVVTRPLLSLLYPMLGNQFRSNLDLVEETVALQNAASRLKTASV